MWCRSDRLISNWYPSCECTHKTSCPVHDSLDSGRSSDAMATALYHVISFMTSQRQQRVTMGYGHSSNYSEIQYKYKIFIASYTKKCIGNWHAIKRTQTHTKQHTSKLRPCILRQIIKYNYGNTCPFSNCSRWNLRMDKQFHPTLYSACEFIHVGIKVRTIPWELNRKYPEGFLKLMPHPDDISDKPNRI